MKLQPLDRALGLPSGLPPTERVPAGIRALRFGGSLAAVCAVIALNHEIVHANATTAALMLLLVILGISARWGLAEATAASILAMLGFNFYFLEPIGRLSIEDPQNWVALAAFLVTAATASQLSAYARRQMTQAVVQRQESERLYALLQAMTLTGNPRRALREFVRRVMEVFGCAGAALYYVPTGEVVRSGPECDPISDHALKAASELDEGSLNEHHTIFTSPVRLGGRSLGSLALVAPLPTEGTLRAVASLVAITLEKARAIEEANYAEAVHQSEILKAALLDSLAHDIKTPLTSIKAAVTTMLGIPGGAQNELLTIVNEEADRLTRLSEEFVAMARVDAGKLHLEKRPLHIAELIRSAVADLPSINKRSVAVDVGDLPLVDADPELIQQVLRHLIENALKYSPEGSPVTISATLKGGRVVIDVSDRGTGIEENERLRIFDRFYRGRRHRFDTKGTGMGLAIAKGIIEAHGERIWVESEGGRGSVFSFSLPLSRS